MKMAKLSSPSRTDPNRIQEIRILPNGTVKIDWVNVSFSKFIIDHVLSDKEREMYKKYHTDKIYCG